MFNIVNIDSILKILFFFSGMSAARHCNCNAIAVSNPSAQGNLHREICRGICRGICTGGSAEESAGESAGESAEESAEESAGESNANAL